MSVQVEEMPNEIEDEVAPTMRTLADLIRELGDIDPSRILLVPTPGTATVADVERYECELIDGTLVRKPMGFEESTLACYLIEMLNAFVRRGNIGLSTGPDGFYRIFDGTVRAPDLAFVSWASLPKRRRPIKPIPDLVPDFCLEVLSIGNTKREMKRKRKDYFTAGVKLVWLIDPSKRTATVYDADDAGTLLPPTGSLDGGKVLPGFTLPLA